LQEVVHRGLESIEREAKDCLEEAKASREEYNRKLKALSADNSVLEEKNQSGGNLLLGVEEGVCRLGNTTRGLTKATREFEQVRCRLEGTCQDS
jgi:hypothetical protein